MLKSALLPSRHAFFTREGGVSEGIYAGLNCGPGSNDNPEHVAENRRRAMEKIDAEPEQLCTLYQIHSAKVLTLTEKWQGDAPQADAMVTKTKGLVLGILTADCAPVLFGDPNGIIGAAHAGWKGALGGVLENTVVAMERLGGSRKNITAAIGPCIHQSSYEVGQEFVEKLLQENLKNRKFFRSRKENPASSYFNLPGYVAYKLTQAGIARVDIIPHDTYKSEASFYSFRRTTHRKEPDYGRQLSAIRLS